MKRSLAFDASHDRLVFLNVAPDQAYWEALWENGLTETNIRRGDRFVTSETRRVLPSGARVLDAGCGIAATVNGLASAGYQAEGIDYAEATVAAVNRLAPELKVRLGDVRSLDYADEELDGVWSLGVIEHFFDGFDPLIEETFRVLRPGGYFFLTVPVISPLKAVKLALGRYENFRAEDRARFFQFAFRRAHVVSPIETVGFRLCREYGRSGAFGLTEDLPAVARALGLKPDSALLPARIWWRAVDRLVTGMAYHTRFFLFQKPEIQSPNDESAP